MVLFVIFEVATLAQGSEVSEIVVTGVVVEVGNGEDDFTAGFWVRFMIFRSTIRKGWRAFAAIAGTLKDSAANLLPIRRVL